MVDEDEDEAAEQPEAPAEQPEPFNLTLPDGCHLLPTSLQLPDGPAFDQWAGIVGGLLRSSKASPWWIGDALLYADKHTQWGSKYAAWQHDQSAQSTLNKTGLRYGTGELQKRFVLFGCLEGLPPPEDILDPRRVPTCRRHAG